MCVLFVSSFNLKKIASTQLLPSAKGQITNRLKVSVAYMCFVIILVYSTASQQVLVFYVFIYTVYATLSHRILCIKAFSVSKRHLIDSCLPILFSLYISRHIW